MPTTPLTEIVLLGAGHAHVEVLRRQAVRPDRRTRLTLVTRERHTPYSGLLPALLRGEVAHDAAHIDAVTLAAASGARVVLGAAEGIDLAARRVAVARHAPVAFDLLSVDVGGAPPAMGGVIPVKPIGLLLDRLARLEADLAQGARIAVLGSGAGGTELALALAHRLAGRATILLVGAAAEPVAAAPPSARRAVAAALRDAGVERHDGVAASHHADGALWLADGRVLPCAAALSVTGVTGPAFLAATGLPCDASGCLRVDARLRALGEMPVFAAGDCAARDGAPWPKAGAWAVRAGPFLAENLRRAASGQALLEWRPPAQALAILGFGAGEAVAWRGGFTLSGRLPALWKARIDRRWIRRYRSLAAA